MLQRAQSLFLALSGCFMITMVFFPFWSKTDLDTGSKFFFSSLGTTMKSGAGEVLEIQYFPYLIIGILGLMSAGIAFFELFQYGNRLLQIKIGAINSLFMGISLGGAIYFITQFDKEIFPYSPGSFHEGFYLPAAAMLSNVIANRLIKRDEKIVKNADRMR
jgi:Domain of unknown function (DUF4293)